MTYIYITLTVLAAFYALWVFYLAVMNLKRVKDTVGLSPIAMFFGTPVLIVGYVLDAILNIIPMSIVLLEFPEELTISERLKRHNRESTGWRRKVAQWFEPLLDPFDPSGNHI